MILVWGYHGRRKGLVVLVVCRFSLGWLFGEVCGGEEQLEGDIAGFVEGCL